MAQRTGLAGTDTPEPPSGGPDGRLRVLFVSMGDICRSPMAEAVFRHMAEAAGLGRRVEVASAGTCTWHLGRPPHPGALAALARHGLCLDHKVAQSLEAVALDAFDCLVAMDRANARDAGPRAVLLLDFARPRPLDPDVPDPYYTGAFDEVYDLIETGCRGLLDRIAGAG